MPRDSQVPSSASCGSSTIRCAAQAHVRLRFGSKSQLPAREATAVRQLLQRCLRPGNRGGTERTDLRTPSKSTAEMEVEAAVATTTATTTTTPMSCTTRTPWTVRASWSSEQLGKKMEVHHFRWTQWTSQAPAPTLTTPHSTPSTTGRPPFPTSALTLPWSNGEAFRRSRAVA